MESDADMLAATEIVDAEPASTIVLLSGATEHDLTPLLQAGWSPDGPGPAPEILTWIDARSGATLWPVGAFDDPESGVVAFGDAALISLIGSARAHHSQP